MRFFIRNLIWNFLFIFNPGLKTEAAGVTFCIVIHKSLSTFPFKLFPFYFQLTLNP